MIGFVTLGTTDLGRAAQFYDALLSEIGAERFMGEEGHFISWAVNGKDPSLAIVMPFDGKPAAPGNGITVGFVMDNSEQVDSFYQKALALGAKDNGAPGPRAGGSYYGAYFLDLDGNKLTCYCS